MFVTSASSVGDVTVAASPKPPLDSSWVSHKSDEIVAMRDRGCWVLEISIIGICYGRHCEVSDRLLGSYRSSWRRSIVVRTLVSAPANFPYPAPDWLTKFSWHFCAESISDYDDDDGASRAPVVWCWWRHWPLRFLTSVKEEDFCCRVGLCVVSK